MSESVQSIALLLTCQAYIYMIYHKLYLDPPEIMILRIMMRHSTY